MAYFSGNAIYIRNSMKNMQNNYVCGGASILSNSFKQNIGMKAHNGGAISVSCYYLTSKS